MGDTPKNFRFFGTPLKGSISTASIGSLLSLQHYLSEKKARHAINQSISEMSMDPTFLKE
jgi:hypothetical protein